MAVDGSVKRPAIYETKNGASVADVVALAGGLEADAYPEAARIERIDTTKTRTVLSADLDDTEVTRRPTVPGDRIFVPQVLPQLEQTVELIGHVHRAGPNQWRRGMRLTDLLRSISALKPRRRQRISADPS